jgi:quinol-cytochrome oxidoreductase complex cytochrome b subunit
MTNLINSLTQSRVWRSFFRHGWPDNPLDRSLVMTTNVFFHLHSVKVSRKSLRTTYSFGLGLISVIVFAVLSITGLLLMFYYVPSLERAYSYILILQTRVPFGQLLRNMHRWGAHLMVIVVVLHMARVFYTGAYKPPREFNWVIGVLLLILTLAASFSGYLLPWDQLAYWAITVGTSVASYEPLMGNTIRAVMLGGSEVGQEALTRFYAFHIIVIPAAIALLTSVHLWRVRKDGGLAAQDAGGDETESKEGSNDD